ncbi:MAG: PepSY domain-containing protein [Pseudomonadota bacterium]
MKAKFTVSFTGSLLAFGILAGTAFADGNVACTNESKDKWQPQEKAEAAAKAQGYDVRKTIETNGCYEVYGIKDGSMFELFYNPVNLALKATVKK